MPMPSGKKGVSPGLGVKNPAQISPSLWSRKSTIFKPWEKAFQGHAGRGFRRRRRQRKPTRSRSPYIRMTKPERAIIQMMDPALVLTERLLELVLRKPIEKARNPAARNHV